ncbi:iron-containing alcohol dehydrogenase [Streptomyces sp. NPDC007940]|uniref:iron-containing alcohol dehydrogenase n=1 Tax=Streptomyces sp. NPDC007940 TaxID=3364796 RepID=UPI0036E68775
MTIRVVLGWGLADPDRRDRAAAVRPAGVHRTLAGLLPVAAGVDCELARSMSARLTADAGVDALTHAVEAYVSRRANPFSDAFCPCAIRTIGRHLRRVHGDGGDLVEREVMVLAAPQAGIAFSKSSVALVHGMSRPVGAHFHVAHGYGHCASALGAPTDGDSDALAAGRLVEAGPSPVPGS